MACHVVSCLWISVPVRTRSFPTLHLAAFFLLTLWDNNENHLFLGSFRNNPYSIPDFWRCSFKYLHGTLCLPHCTVMGGFFACFLHCHAHSIFLEPSTVPAIWYAKINVCYMSPGLWQCSWRHEEDPNNRTGHCNYFFLLSSISEYRVEWWGIPQTDKYYPVIIKPVKST